MDKRLVAGFIVVTAIVSYIVSFLGMAGFNCSLAQGRCVRLFFDRAETPILLFWLFHGLMLVLATCAVLVINRRVLEQRQRQRLFIMFGGMAVLNTLWGLGVHKALSLQNSAMLMLSSLLLSIVSLLLCIRLYRRVTLASLLLLPYALWVTYLMFLAYMLEGIRRLY